IVFVLGLFLLLTMSVAYADDACRCKGCGCKGGPGWRGPDRLCVSKASLAKVCGTPAGAPCKQESATRVCFGAIGAGRPEAGAARNKSRHRGLLADGAVA